VLECATEVTRAVSIGSELELQFGFVGESVGANHRGHARECETRCDADSEPTNPRPSCDHPHGRIIDVRRGVRNTIA
jgi:hypothetical protein